MITQITPIEELKQMWLEIFLNKTDKVSDVSAESVLNAMAYADSKIGQKIMVNQAVIEGHIFPDTAAGEYLGFVDSDDWVSPHYLEWMTEAMQDSVEARLLVACAHVYYRMESSPYADEALLKELGDEARRMWKLTKRIQKRT